MLDISLSVLTLDEHAPAVLVGALLQKLQAIATAASVRDAEDGGIEIQSGVPVPYLAPRLLASVKEIQGRRRPVESFMKFRSGLEVNAKSPVARLE
jgi:hypothetical protein